MPRFILIHAMIVFSIIFAFNNIEAKDILAPEIVEQINQNTDSEYISAIVLMKDRIDLEYLENLVKNISRSERKSIVWEELKSFSQQSQYELMEYIEKEHTLGNILKYNSIILANAIALEARPEVFEALTRRNDIKYILPDELQEVLYPADKRYINELDDIAWGVTRINADQVWDDYTGDGVLVAVIDTGVNYNHSDLADHLWDGGQEYPNHGYDFIYEDNDPMDGNGHGTHVSGTVCGDGTSGTNTGVAPDATLMCLKVLADNGAGFASDVWLGLDFALEHEADVVNMSLGFYNSSAEEKSTWRSIFDNLNQAGIISCVASGNEQELFEPPNEVRTPGNVPSPWRHPDEVEEGSRSGVISVGATDSANELAVFSSRGPVTWQSVPDYYDYPYGNGSVGLIIPDISAPGVEINSLDSEDEQGYVSTDWSGTSMACPHVAGVVCLMLSKSSQLLPVEVDSILQNTTINLAQTGNKDNSFGAGLVQADDAINAVSNGLGTLTGTVRDSNTDEPLADIRIRPIGSFRFGITDENGFYSFELYSGQYDLTVDLPPYEIFQQNAVVIQNNQETTININLNVGILTTDPDSLALSLINDPFAQRQIEISNTGSAPVEVSLSVIPSRQDGEYLNSHISNNLTNQTENSQIWGLAYGNDKFYISGIDNNQDSHQIYVIDSNGELINSFDQPGDNENVSGMFDLAFDGTYLWGSYSRDLVAMNPETGQEQYRIPGGDIINRGLTYDSDRNLLWTATIVGEIIGLDPATGDVSIRFDGVNTVMGMGYWANDPDGYPLYLGVMEGNNDRHSLFKANPETGEYYKIADLPLEDQYAMVMGLTLVEDFEKYYTTVFGIINQGQNPYSDDFFYGWDLRATVGWASVVENSITINANDNRTVAIDFNGNGLVDGEYDAILKLTHNTLQGVSYLPLHAAAQNVEVDEVQNQLIPESFVLSQPYPNPFNNQVTIKYRLPIKTQVKMTVYDLLGREIDILAEGLQTAGEHSINMSSDNLASGMYFIKLQADGYLEQSAKIVLLK